MLLIMGVRDGLDGGPTPFVQHPVDRLAATANNQPVSGNTSHQMMELGLDRGEVGENIRMVIFEVIDDRRFRAVMNKLGTLVEKGGVILICLDHKEVSATQPRG